MATFSTQFRDDKAIPQERSLRALQNLLGPSDGRIVRNDDGREPVAVESFHTALHKCDNALAAIARTPGRIGVESLRSPDEPPRKRLRNIVELSGDVLPVSASFCETIDGFHDPLVEIEDMQMRGTFGKKATFPEVKYSERHAVAVTDKDYLEATELLRKKGRLLNHIFILHENLIELADGFRAVLDDFGQCTDCFVKVGFHPPFGFGAIASQPIAKRIHDADLRRKSGLERVIPVNFEITGCGDLSPAGLSGQTDGPKWTSKLPDQRSASLDVSREKRVHHLYGPRYPEWLCADDVK